VDEVVGFRASDFRPELLAGLFFTGTEAAEQNGFEGFTTAANGLYGQVPDDQVPVYTLDQIMAEVRRRSDPNNPLPPEDAIHEKTGPSILRKVNARRGWFPWLDAVGTPLRPAVANHRYRASVLDGGARTVKAFDLKALVAPGRILVIDYSHMDDQSYAVLLSYFLRECQRYRKESVRPGDLPRPGLVQLVDEAHRVFDNRTKHGPALAGTFGGVMREGRSVDHSIILSLQNASQVHQRVMNNLNSKIVMRQNSRAEADAATETMGKDFALQAMRLGTGHALVSLHESRATVLAQMAPSPYELMRTDNAERPAPPAASRPAPGAGPASPPRPAPAQPQKAADDDIPF
jgi:hypothetical protein